MDRFCVYTGGMASANGYLIKGEDDNTYVAIDAPHGFTDWILHKETNITISHLLITHQHFDHVEDAAKMKQTFGCKIHAHSQYSDVLTLEKLAREAWGMPLHVEPFEVDSLTTADHQSANWGGLLWHAECVPGHSSDSLVYILPDEELCFSGDTLFAGSIGRTDLPGGNTKLLLNSITSKILSQPANTRVFPGHGPYTTVKSEMLTNSYLA